MLVTLFAFLAKNKDTQVAAENSYMAAKNPRQKSITTVKVHDDKKNFSYIVFTFLDWCFLQAQPIDFLDFFLEQ